MSLQRRTLLTGCGTILVPLSGCASGVLTDPPRVDLVLRNYTPRRQPLQLEVLRAGDAGGDPVVLEREFEVPPAGEGDAAGTVRQSDALPSRRLLVRVRLKFGRGTWNHHHHVPDGGDGEEVDVRVYRDDDTDRPYSRFF